MLIDRFVPSKQGIHTPLQMLSAPRTTIRPTWLENREYGFRRRMKNNSNKKKKNNKTSPKQ